MCVIFLLRLSVKKCQELVDICQRFEVLLWKFKKKIISMPSNCWVICDFNVGQKSKILDNIQMC